MGRLSSGATTLLGTWGVHLQKNLEDLPSSPSVDSYTDVPQPETGRELGVACCAGEKSPQDQHSPASGGAELERRGPWYEGLCLSVCLHVYI